MWHQGKAGDIAVVPELPHGGTAAAYFPAEQVWGEKAR